MRSNPHTAYESSATVHEKFETVHGVPNSARGKVRSVHGSPTTVHENLKTARGKGGDVRDNARGEPVPRSVGQQTSPSGARHQKKKLGSTHRVVSRTKGLPGALSHGAQVPNPLAPEPPEVVLAGMGVDPLKITGLVEGKPVTVMIDSGSAGNFISRKAAERLGMEETIVLRQRQCTAGGWQQAPSHLAHSPVSIEAG